VLLGLESVDQALTGSLAVVQRTGTRLGTASDFLTRTQLRCRVTSLYQRRDHPRSFPRPMTLRELPMSSSLRELADRCHSASSFTEVGEAVLRALRQTVCPSGANVFPMYAGADPTVDAVAFSDHMPGDLVLRQGCEIWPTSERELGSVTRFFSLPNRIMHATEHFGQASLDKTATYNEYWRPCRIERHVMVMMGSARDPIGFICATRSIRERAWSEVELETLGSVRCVAECAVRRIVASSSPYPSRAVIVTALASALPLACALFDERGRLAWMSERAVNDLGATFTSTGHVRFACAASRQLAIWRDTVRTAAASSLRQVRQGPTTVSQVQCSDGTTLYLLVNHGSVSQSQSDPWAELTGRERELASLAIEGYSVFNMAAVASLSAGTVRNHLKNIYRKTGVCSRAELTLRLLGR
jgi:DNA-binding CsgD family transcriptional regulator